MAIPRARAHQICRSAPVPPFSLPASSVQSSSRSRCAFSVHAAILCHRAHPPLPIVVNHCCCPFQFAVAVAPSSPCSRSSWRRYHCPRPAKPHRAQPPHRRRVQPMPTAQISPSLP
ncbi:hypothetical protein M0R45_036232 [Rubus argutus]|uniref:Uncharacterized protein n=1 Tax=Rubus argutus TaxID=59490 RepID=A0AAW1VX90_RUBAR